MLATSALLGLALALSPQPGQDTRPPSLVAALPDDATLIVAVEDFATFWERAQRSDWNALMSDPALAPMWTELDASFQEELGDEDVFLASALEALDGAAFFSTSPGDDDENAYGLVLRLRPDARLLTTILRAEVERRGAPIHHDGRTFRLERAGRPDNWDVYFTWSGGFAVVEGRGRNGALKLATQLARRLEAGVADGPLNARLAGKRPADPATFEAYLDFGALLTTNVKAHSEQDERTHAALQLADFGWGACLFSIGAGSDVELDTLLELPRAGLFPLLAAHARPAPTRMARLAPADTVEVATLGYDAQQAWRSFVTWSATELPEFSEEMHRGLVALKAGTGIDLEHELFDQLSGEFGRLLVPVPEGQRTLNGVTAGMLLGLLGSPGSAGASVYLVSLEDEQVVGRLVEKLIGLSDAADQLREEEVAGHRLRYFEVPELQVDPGWAFVDGVLVVSTHRSAVRSVLSHAGGNAARGWADTRRTAALRGDGRACGSAVADLQALTRVKLASPLAMMLGMTAELPGRTDEPDAASLMDVAEALPGLVEQHISGTARTTLSVDGRVLRYRFWTN